MLVFKFLFLFWVEKQLTTCYYLLSQEKVLVINFVSPGISSIKHLYNSTTQWPNVTLTSRSFFYDYFRCHPLYTSNYLALQRCETWWVIWRSFLEFSRRPKVTKLYDSIVICQDIWALQIQVLDFLVVKICQPIEYLLGVVSDSNFIEVSILREHIRQTCLHLL